MALTALALTALALTALALTALETNSPCLSYDLSSHIGRRNNWYSKLGMNLLTYTADLEKLKREALTAQVEVGKSVLEGDYDRAQKHAGTMQNAFRRMVLLGVQYEQEAE
jgi:hypothetical protein